MDATTKKLAYNIGGGLLGIVLALLVTVGLISQQNSVTQPQKYTSQIQYDSSN